MFCHRLLKTLLQIVPTSLPKGTTTRQNDALDLGVQPQVNLQAYKQYMEDTFSISVSAQKADQEGEPHMTDVETL